MYVQDEWDDILGFNSDTWEDNLVSGHYLSVTECQEFLYYLETYKSDNVIDRLFYEEDEDKVYMELNFDIQSMNRELYVIPQDLAEDDIENLESLFVIEKAEEYALTTNINTR